MTQRSAVLYARISVSTEESVSVQRQIAAARKYAAARDWNVVGEFIDDGVSASRTKPEDRPGWRALLTSVAPFDAVIVWKVDRLARRVVDFLRADEILQTRGAAIVCVEQSIDMTTGEGRAFAHILAVFGEMEAAAISSRVTATRTHLFAIGRIPGGLQPCGWRSVPSPDGPGKVRAQDPERIEWVRGMAARLLHGDTVYSITTWLNDEAAPAPRARQPGRYWGYSAVDTILRNPVLAGLIPTKTGRPLPGGRAPILLDQQGDPIVLGDGILSVAEHQTLIYAMTHKPHHSAVSKKSRRPTSPLLSLLATCQECEILMHRHSSRGQPFLRCQGCGQMVTSRGLGDYVGRRLLAERGARPMYRRAVVAPNDITASRRLATIDHALQTAAAALTEDGANIATLTEKIADLKRSRWEVRRGLGSQAVENLIRVGTLAEIWNMCVGDEQRREVLVGQIETLTIMRMSSEGKFNAKRVTMRWRKDPNSIAPAGITPTPIHPHLNDLQPWMSYRDASELPGGSETIIRRAIRSGDIKQRRVHRSHPSLETGSVLAYLNRAGRFHV